MESARTASAGDSFNNVIMAGQIGACPGSRQFSFGHEREAGAWRPASTWTRIIPSRRYFVASEPAVGQTASIRALSSTLAALLALPVRQLPDSSSGLDGV